MTADSHDLPFETLLEFLKENRGFDFTGYKRTTLQRRVQKRMEAVGATDYAAYLERLSADAGEFTQLFNTLLINVTRFFRDDAPWRFLADEVIPALLQRIPESQAVRVWSAGCASGEEAYTLAMLFAEALGLERFRDRVKIYATDADEDALVEARLAVYGDEQVQPIPDAVRARYMERGERGWAFRKELRRSVIFGRNDLVQNAPISRIDLLVCRNTLMYFNSATQAAILGRFHFALAEGGVLFLGRAETLLTHTSAFTPLELKWRVFSKVPRTLLRERSAITIAMARENGDLLPMRLGDAAFESAREAQIVVSRAGLLALANERARELFGLGRSDLGRPLQDLELSYRPSELRSLLERCYAESARVVVRDIRWRPRNTEEDAWLTLELSPLADEDGATIGAAVVFRDGTEARRLRLELEHSKQNLETAYEELQSTNEELETTNEELQSTVEELETTNEELQSTNEELETMNEELQSTNQELHAMNDELRRRGDELNDLNEFLAAVFASMRGGVVVLDRELRVLVWNAQSQELWGLRSGEAVGSNFFALDIGFPVEQLASRLRLALHGRGEGAMPVIPATNRRGRSVDCRVGCTPLRTVEGTVRGVIVTMEEIGAE